VFVRAKRWLRVGALVVVVVLGPVLGTTACSGGRSSGAQPTQSPLGRRPTSTGTITLVEPRPGAVVTGGTLHVKVDVQGARILNNPNTVTPKPDEGHIHLKLDGTIVSMAYGPEQDIAVKPGQHLLEAEFVAGDHIQFSPRVAAKTTFTAE
jgi:hypothetical protein